MKTKAKVETPKPDERAKDQAKAQVESIVELVTALRFAEDSGDDRAREKAQQAIDEDPLSLEVRTDWHTLNAEDLKPTHFRILLCWGGPACQIIGELDAHLQPDNATVQYQDWGTPWTDYRDTTSEQDAAILEYCRTFYFGE